MIKNNQHLTQLLDSAVSHVPNHIATIGLDTPMSYQQLHQASTTLCQYLLTHTDKGNTAIMLPNLLSFPISLFAIWYSDRTATLINPLSTSNELLKQCLDAQVSTIIIAKIFYKTLKPILPKTQISHIITVDIGDHQPWFKRLLINTLTTIKHRVIISKNKATKLTKLHTILKHKPTEKPRQTLTNPIALLQYTGGTSGTFKAAALSHDNLLANVNQLTHWFGDNINTQSKILTALPLYHIFALMVNCLFFVHIKGCSILVVNPRDTKQLLAPIKKHHINIITGVNTLFNALIYHQEFKEIDWSSLEIAIAGGMALQKDTAQKWQQTVGKPILQGYGLTECSPVVSVEDHNTPYNGSVGHALLDTEIKIIDPEFNQCDVSKRGEICIKGAQVMASYWHKEHLNKGIFTPDGFFRTGDLGYLDEQGRLFIVDRIKDVIIVSGFNVYPIDVETVLNQHQDVIESACIGIDHPASGQALKVFIVKSKESSLTKETMITHCQQYLVEYKVPKEIVWVDTLPKSNVGKILKRLLK